MPSPDSEFALGLSLLLRNELDQSASLFSSWQSRAVEPTQRPGGGTLLERRAAALASFGTGLVAVVRALMSFGEAEVQDAMDKLAATQKLATPPPSGSWMPSFGGASAGPTQEATDLELIGADAGLFLAALQFTSENTMAYLRGGMMIRRSFKMYSKAIRAYAGTDLEAPSGATRLLQRHGTSTHVVVDGSDLFYDALDEDEHELTEQYSRSGRDRGLIDLQVCSSVEERVRGSAQLGIGLFHLIFSLIPSRWHYIIKTTMGFDSSFKEDADRRKGLRLLRACLDGGSTRAPVAALSLLIFHSAMLIVARGVSDDADTTEASYVLEVCLRHHHDSPLFRFFEGRLHRGKCQLSDAVVSFTAAELRAGPVVPLRQLCMYERAWCEALQGRYLEAAELFSTLARQSPWSPAFYGFLAACCFFEHGSRLVLLMSADTRDLLGDSVVHRASKSMMKAMALFQAVPGAVRPHGPNKRLIPPEAYSAAKSSAINALAGKILAHQNQHKHHHHNHHHNNNNNNAPPSGGSLSYTKRQLEDLCVTCFSPFMEIAYFWNGLFQLDQATRLRELNNLDVIADHCRMSGALGFEPTYLLLKAAMLRESHNLHEANVVLTRLEGFKGVGSGAVGDGGELREGEHWVGEYAKFERGLLYFSGGEPTKALGKWNEIKDSQHPFDARLKFRVRTAVRTAGNVVVAGGKGNV